MQLYSKFIEEMENEILQKIKDPFPKTVSDAWRILARWNNHYGNRDNRLNEANDKVAFITTGDKNKKNNKKKEITLFKCKKGNECDG